MNARTARLMREIELPPGTLRAAALIYLAVVLVAAAI